MKRRALGKGLGSLLPERPVAGRQEGLLQVPVEELVPNPRQPRQDMDEEGLNELAESIKEAGLLQPVVVRDTGHGYELIAGERRLRAAKLAGLKSIPALIKDADAQRSLELAVIENIQRQQLNPIEEATAFAELMEEFGLTHAEVADKVGRQRSSITNTLRLLNLPEPVQAMIREGKLTRGHAKALLSLSDQNQIIRSAELMSQSTVTVRKAEEIAREGRPAGDAKPFDANYGDAELRLQRALGTKVRIKVLGKGRGRIEIDYYSNDELQRLFEVLEAQSAR